MYISCTRHRIKNYEQWRKAFDENAQLLRDNGITEWWILQVNGDPTDIAVIVSCPSKKEWDDFVVADQEKFKQTGIDPRVKGGLIGQPEWFAGDTV